MSYQLLHVPCVSYMYMTSTCALYSPHRVHVHCVYHTEYICTVWCDAMLQTLPLIGATTRWSRRATTACAWRGRVTSASRTSPCTGAAPTGYRKLNAWSVRAPFSCADILGWLYILQQNRGVCFCVIYDVLSGGCLQVSLAASLFVHSFLLRALMLHVQCTCTCRCGLPIVSFLTLTCHKYKTL